MKKQLILQTTSSSPLKMYISRCCLLSNIIFNDKGKITQYIFIWSSQKSSLDRYQPLVNTGKASGGLFVLFEWKGKWPFQKMSIRGKSNPILKQMQKFRLLHLFSPKTSWWRERVWLGDFSRKGTDVVTGGVWQNCT